MKQILCCLLAVLCLNQTNLSAQVRLEFERNRNVPPSQQYPEKNPENVVEGNSRTETVAQQRARLRSLFGDAESAITLVEDIESSRKIWVAEQVRNKLNDAKGRLQKIKSRRISKKKRKQLALAWGRLARSERFLFGDTIQNLEWLRKAHELDPDNQDVARALDVAERKNEYAQRRLEEAAKIRAARERKY